MMLSQKKEIEETVRMSAAASQRNRDNVLLYPNTTFSRQIQPTEQHLNDIELMAIQNLIAYVAYVRDLDERTIHTIVSARFEIVDVVDIPTAQYQEAFDFLLGLSDVGVAN